MPRICTPRVISMVGTMAAPSGPVTRDSASGTARSVTFTSNEVADEHQCEHRGNDVEEDRQ